MSEEDQCSRIASVEAAVKRLRDLLEEVPYLTNVPKWTKKRRTEPKSNVLLDYLMLHRITNRTSFDERPSEEIREFLSMPQLESMLARGFNYVSTQIRHEEKEFYHVSTKLLYKYNGHSEKIERFLVNFQNWTYKQYAFFMKIIRDVSNFKTLKRNTIWIYGPANTGKSTLLDSFIRAYFDTGVGKPDNNENTSFPFNNCINKRIIFWEEPTIHNKNIEDVKALMSGTTFSTDVKYQSAVEIRRTPLLVTANLPPWHGQQDSHIMRSRCFPFKMSNVIRDDEEMKDKYFPFTKEDWERAFIAVDLHDELELPTAIVDTNIDVM